MPESNQNLNLKERMAAITASQNKAETSTEASINKEVVAKKEAAPTPDLKIEAKLEPLGAAPIQEKLYNVFYSTLESCRMITKGGRNIAFVLGKYVTAVPEEIQYLQEEISLGNSRISVIPGKEQMTADDLDPMKALKKQHIKEYLADQALLDKNVAAGTLSESSSETQKLVPGSTADTAGLADQA